MEPTPEATTDPSLLQTALALSATAGFEIAPNPAPVVTDRRPDFDPMLLRRVALPLAGEDGLTLDVFLDPANRIRVVSDGFYNRPMGPAASRSEILDAARRDFDLVGLDLASGEVRVAAGPVAGRWYLTFDRQIAGYDVANAPMSWWLAGDKAYLELRTDASLVNLYAIQPENRPIPDVLATAVLEQRLATAAGISASELPTLERGPLWIRAQDAASGIEENVLTLGYCATKRSDSSWEAWCVDAATGALSARGSGFD